MQFYFWRFFFILILTIHLMACGTSSSSSTNDPDTDNLPDPITSGNWYQPSVGTSWQWQINDSLNTSYDVDVYDIDLENNSANTITELHNQGKRVICYFSAGTFEDFREDADQFPAEVLGTALEDFPDEKWLDIRSAEVLAIITARMDSAVTKGCDGVEPDNVDGYANNNGFDLTAEDQLLYNATIANEAHQRNLAVGLKNDLDQINSLLNYFDFSVNEQCHEFEECDALQPFIDANKAVFNAEYDDTYVNDASTRNALCDNAIDQNLSTLILPVDLDDAFRFSC